MVWSSVKPKIIIGRPAASTSISLFSPGMKGEYINKHVGPVSKVNGPTLVPDRGKTSSTTWLMWVITLQSAFVQTTRRVLFVRTVCGVDTTATAKDNHNQCWTVSVMQLIWKEYCSGAKTGDRHKWILSWVRRGQLREEALDKESIWCVVQIHPHCAASASCSAVNTRRWAHPHNPSFVDSEKYRPSVRATHLRRWIKVNVEYKAMHQEKTYCGFLKRHIGHKASVMHWQQAQTGQSTSSQVLLTKPCLWSSVVAKWYIGHQTVCWSL